VAAGDVVVIDGVRYRFDEAVARGLIGERPVPAAAEDAKEAAPVAKPVRPKNKSRRPATK